MNVKVLVPQSGLTLSHTMDVSLQVPLSMEMEFSRQEYWSGSPFPRASDFNFMALVIVYKDFGAEANKVCHCLHFLPCYLP